MPRAGGPAARGGGGAPPGRAAAAAGVVVAAWLWSLTGPHARLCYALGLTPEQLAAARAGTAFLALLAWTAARRAWPRLGRRDAPLLAAAGVGGVGLFYLALLWSMRLNPVAVASVLLYTAPAFLALAERLAGRRLGWRRAASLAVVLVGVYLVGGGHGPVTAAGLWVGLAAGAAYALYSGLTAVAAARVGVTGTLLGALGVGTLVLLPAAARAPWPGAALQPAALALVVGGGIGLTLIPYALYTRALRVLAPADAGTLAALEPVFTAVWGYALLDERLEPTQGLGAACVVAAALALVRRLGEEGSDAGAVAVAGGPGARAADG